MYLYLFNMLLLTTMHCVAGESYFKALHEHILSAQETLKDVATSVVVGLKTLGKTAKFLEQFIDSTIEEDCEFKCLSGRLPFPNPDHVAKSDGCGSFGLYYDRDDLPLPEMANCCNGHDLCYDKCGNDKEECDLLFKRCLYKSCEMQKAKMNLLTHKKCQGGAKLLYMATIALGCSSFKEAQKNACMCVYVAKQNDEL